MYRYSGTALYGALRAFCASIGEVWGCASAVSNAKYRGYDLGPCAVRGLASMVPESCTSAATRRRRIVELH